MICGEGENLGLKICFIGSNIHQRVNLDVSDIVGGIRNWGLWIGLFCFCQVEVYVTVA